MIDESKIVFEFEKSYHISYNQEYFCCVGETANLYDLTSGKLVTTFKGMSHPHSSKFTSNQKLVIKTGEGVYYIYDLCSRTLDKMISPPPDTQGSITNFEVTPDGKYIIDFAYIHPIKKLMTIDIETGMYTFFDLSYSRKGFVFSTEMESKYYIVSNSAENNNSSDVAIQEIYELTYRSNMFNLQRIFLDSNSRISVADYSANKFAIADYSNKIKLFDTHKAYCDDFEYDKNGVLYNLKISKNGQFIAIVESQNVYIYDVFKKTCIQTFNVEYGCFVDFFQNDTKLLIGTWKKGYCISLKKTGEGSVSPNDTK